MYSNSANKPWKHRQHGYTLVELLMVVAITGVLAAVGIPSFTDSLSRNRVAGAAEGIYGMLLQAQTDGKIRDIDLSFNTNTVATPWCAGYSATAGCDCTNTSSCVVDVAGTSVLQTISGTDFPGVTIAETFATGGGTTFSRIRGSASQAGAVTLTADTWQLNVIVSADGQLRICNPVAGVSSIAGYAAC